MDSVGMMLMEVVLSAWDVLLDSAFFILFGFFVAGFLKALLPDDMVARHLGEKKSASVLKASLVGIPIPLCSCGVLPAAAGLKQQGASHGAVASFMISTPETGVDSIAITYALLDPIMTVFRPLSAFITAVTTGLFVNLIDKGTDKDSGEPIPLTGCRSGSACCSGESSHQVQTEAIVHTHEEHGSGHSDGCGCGSGVDPSASLAEKIKVGMGFSFGELLDDIGAWLFFGIILAGIISTFVSPQMVETYLGSEWASMLFMLVLATPLYVCTTASTPIAAAFVLKGLSPGAALVFLLAGPATNVATITVVSRVIGKRAAAIYVGSILVCSLVMGYVVNIVYAKTGMDIHTWQAIGESETFSLVSFLSAILLLLFIARGYGKRLIQAASRFFSLNHSNADISTKA